MSDGPNMVYTGTRYGPYFVSIRTDPFFHDALTRYGEWSWLEVEFLRPIIEPGDVIVSAGTHCGALIVPFGQMVGRTGGVIGFEPQLHLWGLAQANTVLCNVDDQCHVLFGALGAAPGQIMVQVPDYRAVNSFGGMSLRFTPDSGPLKKAVPLHTIDGLGLKRCDLIQLDIEGMELEAMQGARATVLAHQPTLYLEVIYDHVRWPLFSYLRDLGYRMWWHIPPLYNPDNFKGDPENVWPQTASLSWLAVHADREVPAIVEGLREVQEADWETVGLPVPDAPHTFPAGEGGC